MVDDIRGVLRRHEALLVHFNTPMTRHSQGYPQDLREAYASPEWRMCYSTILKTDVGPSQSRIPGNAVACGSVGIIVDLNPESNIISAHESDSGSNGRLDANALGSLPSVEACEKSIMIRSNGHNEWFLSGSRPIGIFYFPYPMIFRPGEGEAYYDPKKIADDFPDKKIYTVDQGRFVEFDRDTGKLVPRTYTEIVPA